MERKDVNVGRFIGQVIRDTPKLMNFPLYQMNGAGG